MVKVTLVGTGTVSNHLQRVFSNTNGVDVLRVMPSRGDEELKAVSREEDGDYKTEQPDLYILAVSDDAITSVSKHFITSKKLVVHTSGSVSLDALPDGVRKGVFYPLQTFSKEKEVDFQTIPICIEAEKKEDLDLLRKLADSISISVYELTSEQRSSLHLAAVFVNNFSNHMYQIGNQICEENGVSFDILKPLIAETVQKISSLSPIEAQTGPAKRNDGKTIERHIKQLKSKTHREVYEVLTKSIKETFKEIKDDR